MMDAGLAWLVQLLGQAANRKRRVVRPSIGQAQSQHAQLMGNCSLRMRSMKASRDRIREVTD
jgi:hypothetical protein